MMFCNTGLGASTGWSTVAELDSAPRCDADASAAPFAWPIGFCGSFGSGPKKAFPLAAGLKRNPGGDLYGSFCFAGGAGAGLTFGGTTPGLTPGGGALICLAFATKT